MQVRAPAPALAERLAVLEEQRLAYANEAECVGAQAERAARVGTGIVRHQVDAYEKRCAALKERGEAMSRRAREALRLIERQVEALQRPTAAVETLLLQKARFAEAVRPLAAQVTERRVAAVAAELEAARAQSEAVRVRRAQAALAFEQEAALRAQLAREREQLQRELAAERAEHSARGSGASAAALESTASIAPAPPRTSNSASATAQPPSPHASTTRTAPPTVPPIVTNRAVLASNASSPARAAQPDALAVLPPAGRSPTPPSPVALPLGRAPDNQRSAGAGDRTSSPQLPAAASSPTVAAAAAVAAAAPASSASNLVPTNWRNGASGAVTTPASPSLQQPAAAAVTSATPSPVLAAAVAQSSAANLPPPQQQQQPAVPETSEPWLPQAVSLLHASLSRRCDARIYENALAREFGEDVVLQCVDMARASNEEALRECDGELLATTLLRLLATFSSSLCPMETLPTEVTLMPLSEFEHALTAVSAVSRGVWITLRQHVVIMQCRDPAATDLMTQSIAGAACVHAPHNVGAVKQWLDLQAHIDSGTQSRRSADSAAADLGLGDASVLTADDSVLPLSARHSARRSGGAGAGAGVALQTGSVRFSLGHTGRSDSSALDGSSSTRSGSNTTRSSGGAAAAGGTSGGAASASVASGAPAAGTSLRSSSRSVLSVASSKSLGSGASASTLDVSRPSGAAGVGGVSPTLSAAPVVAAAAAAPAASAPSRPAPATVSARKPSWLLGDDSSDGSARDEVAVQQVASTGAGVPPAAAPASAPPPAAVAPPAPSMTSAVPASAPARGRADSPVQGDGVAGTGTASNTSAPRTRSAGRRTLGSLIVGGGTTVATQPMTVGGLAAGPSLTRAAVPGATGAASAGVRAASSGGASTAAAAQILSGVPVDFADSDSEPTPSSPSLQAAAGRAARDAAALADSLRSSTSSAAARVAARRRPAGQSAAESSDFEFF